MSPAARKKSLTHYSNADFLQKRRLSGYSSQGKGRKKAVVGKINARAKRKAPTTPWQIAEVSSSNRERKTIQILLRFFPFPPPLRKAVFTIAFRFRSVLASTSFLRLLSIVSYLLALVWINRWLFSNTKKEYLRRLVVITTTTIKKKKTKQRKKKKRNTVRSRNSLCLPVALSTAYAFSASHTHTRKKKVACFFLWQWIAKDSQKKSENEKKKGEKERKVGQD